ncbi:MAG: ethanolamine ammonia-lyase light chain EutC [Methylococcaceae bacterium]
MPNKTIATNDPWAELKQYTSARIALGRAGGSLPTKAWLDFKLAHAKARDAVHCEFNSKKLLVDLKELKEKVLVVNSKVNDRAAFLQRPDLGRLLHKDSTVILESEKTAVSRQLSCPI